FQALLRATVGDSSKLATPIAFFVLTTVNAYFFFFGEFKISDEKQWLMALIAGALMFAGAWIVWLRKPVLLFSSILVAISIYNYASGRISLASVELAGSSTTAAFQSKPNFYAISFESLLSPYALKHLYDASDMDHFDALRERGFRVLDGAYSAGSATIASLSQVLEYEENLQTSEQMRAVFGSKNTTYRIFKENGYKVNFMYASNYLGANRGGADYFFPEKSFSTCHFLSDSYLYFACHKDFANWVNQRLFGESSYISVDQHLALIKDRVDAIVDSDDPGFIFTHINFPGHTRLDHDYRDTKAISGFADQTRNWIPQIKNYFEDVFDHIIESDPNAVILVYGDHGAWISRGMTSSVADEADSPFSLGDMLLDRHGVAMAIYPNNFCEERIREGTSTLLLMRSIFACLSGETEMTRAEHEVQQQIFFEGKRRDLHDLLRPSKGLP
ncbi:MAG: hypothetical protein ACR2P3_05235, partial [Geminicoccaceae bacterium]